ncbi:ECF-type sigma factor [Derxia lacustris]|uniref:ECF-type sigma factor n=1 Tax=Derxia lacustris TaxID=764842 RepID=UPI001C383BFD|nr:ECF-type sigma factor [Derxia lacustris]
MGEVTRLIERARDGDRAAFDRLFELLYPELRQIAHRRLARSGRDGLMQTTALVNECYLKFAQREALAPADRAHFLAYSATVMRSVIVDAARLAGSARRGGDAEHVELDTAHIDALPDSSAAQEILAVHGALDELAGIDARLAQVVELRYFGGMADAEIAEALGLSTRTVTRDWDKARLLLAHALRD